MYDGMQYVCRCVCAYVSMYADMKESMWVRFMPSF